MDPVKIHREQIIRACQWMRLRAPDFAERVAKTFAMWGRRWYPDQDSPTTDRVLSELLNMIDGIERNAYDRHHGIPMLSSFGGLDITISYFSGHVEARMEIADSIHQDVTDPKPQKCPTCHQAVEPTKEREAPPF